MLRRGVVARGKRVELDFLPGEKIVVDLKDSFKDVVGKVDSLSKAADLAKAEATDDERYNTKRFLAGVNASIQFRLHVTGDEASDDPNGTALFANLTHMLPSSAMYNASTRPSETALDAMLSHKAVYRPEDVDASSDAVMTSVFASLRSSTRRREREASGALPFLTAPSLPVWTCTFPKVKRLEADHAERRRRRWKAWRRGAVVLPDWTVDGGPGTFHAGSPVWYFNPATYIRPVVAASLLFDTWVDKGSLKRLKARRVAARVRRMYEESAGEAALKDWVFEEFAAPRGRRKKMKTTATAGGSTPLALGVDGEAAVVAAAFEADEEKHRYQAIIENLSPNGSMDVLLAMRAPEVLFVDITRARRRLMDGPLSAILTAMYNKCLGLADGAAKQDYLRLVQKCYAAMCRWHRAGPRTHTAAVTCLARNHRVATALALVEAQLADGRGATAHAITSIISQAAKMKHQQQAGELVGRAVDLAVAHHVKLDARCWSGIIDATTALRGYAAGIARYREALVWERTAANPVLFDEQTYLPLLKAAPPAVGTAIWAEMRRRKVTRSHAALRAWLSACEAHDDIDAALDAACLAAEDGIDPWLHVVHTAYRLDENEELVGNLLVLYGASGGAGAGAGVFGGVVEDVCHMLLCAVASVPYDVTAHPKVELAVPYLPRGLLPPDMAGAAA